ncbi:neuroligin-1-like [Ischnura elegans]|uniref:neuroligin-1-like n=1 Tax=Ischnura elegans TaxID=197161 RepID=UPI001ED878B4|nr:neuroligin-1-like [Ischnura elegans]
MRLPVIVFIHGESFEWNSGNPYDGSILASHGGLVVVTINFRLGVLGFLNANSDTGPFRSPANYGLMDQIAALHWIQENIAAFGGDPGSVTILGHGTGAACANFLMVSPAIPDGMLFHRVILMSGSTLSPWSLVKDPWRHALAVARHVNCTTTPTGTGAGMQSMAGGMGPGDPVGHDEAAEEDDGGGGGGGGVADERLQRLLPPSPRLLRCLREKPLSELTSAPIPTTPFAATAFGPSVDGVVVDADAAGGLLPPPRSTSFGGGGPGSFSGSGSSASSSGGPGSSLGSGPGSLDGTGGSFDSDANGASAAAEAERRRRRKKYVDRLARYDLLFGVVRAEAYFAFTAEDLQYGIETDRRSRLLRTFVRNTYRYHLSEILATVVNEYTDWERPVQHPVNIRDETLEALSDATVVAPLVQTGDYHASAAAALNSPPQPPLGIDPAPAPAPSTSGSAPKTKSTYFYVFEYQTKYGDYPQRQGCVHGEELPYVFGAPLAPQTATPFPKNFTKAETQLSEATIIYWSNFARTGNPNEPQEAEAARGVRQERNRFRNIDWSPYEGMHKKYLSFDTKPRLRNHYRAHRLSFWLNLVPDLHRPGGDGVPATHHLLPSDVASYDGQSAMVPPPPPPRLGPPGTHTPFNLTALLVPPRGQWDEDGPEGQIGESEAEAVASAAASGHGPAPNRTHSTSSSSSSSSSSSGNSPVEAASAAGSENDDGFAAYSTALSVTIAIGCSLLILNVLIFAGVYYQRDKHRLEAKKRSENGRMPNISGEVGDSASSSGGLPSAKASPQTAGGGNGRTQLPPPEFADLPHHHHHHHHHHPAMGGAGLVAVPVPVPPPPKVSSASPGSQSQLPPKAGSAGDEAGLNKVPRSECQPLLPQGIQLLQQTFRTSPIVQSGTATVKKAHQRQAGKVVNNAEELRV